MKTFIKYISASIVLLLLLSLTYYSSQNAEYKKWLNFYNLTDNDFKLVGDTIKVDITWEDYGLSKSVIDIHQSLYVYSKDSSHFIDLDTYSSGLEKRGDEIVSIGFEVDSKVKVVSLPGYKYATLLFCGSICTAETVYWINESCVEILGNEIDDKGRKLPTKWTVDFKSKKMFIYQSEKQINSGKDYIRKIRLKNIRFINE